MRLIFAGTPDFARTALAHLHACGHDITLVLTQPDRPGGRGLKVQASPVKQFALDNNLRLCQPRSLRLDGKYPGDAAAAQALIEAANADAMVVAAYGLILPQWVLDQPKWGCFNIHASLLPRWRGAAPIHRAVEAGDAETGITIMQMDAGLDTGDMLLVESAPISPTDTTGDLHDKLATLGADLIVRALALAQAGTLAPVKQPELGVTYAQKIDKSEAAFDWNQPAQQIVRHVLAFNPAPGATAMLGGETVKIWRAAVADPAQAAGIPSQAAAQAQPGDVLGLAQDGLWVQVQDAPVALAELQRPGGKRLSASAFAQGLPSLQSFKKAS